MIDTHTHLDHNKASAEVQLTAAAEAGVGLLIQSGTDVQSSRLAVRLAEAHAGLYATVGIHPHDAARGGVDGVRELEELAGHPKVVAIGETGLDFYRNRSPQDAQEDVFRAQMELARHQHLPIVIHTRDADSRSIPMLLEHAAGCTVVLHCFSMPERLEEFVELGWFMSFAGNVTYKKAAALQDAVRRVPADLLLLETDAPYLTPEPLRGRDNVPAYITHTYRFVAGVRGVQLEDLARLVMANAGRAFPRLDMSAVA